MIHNFSFFTGYICSYNNTSGSGTSIFDSPVIIPNLLNCRPDYSLGDLYTIDEWSASHGFKRFWPGADAINLVNNDYTTYHEITGIFTLPAYYYIQLIRVSDGSIISQTSQDTCVSGGEELSATVLKSSLTLTDYKWRIYYKPLLDDDYDDYAVGWRYRDLAFHNYGDPLLPSSITDDVTLSGTYYCNTTTISSGVTVTLSSGTTIKFLSGGQLTVNGTLSAVGTSSSKITFTSSLSSPSAGSWYGIYFGNSSVDASCTLKYCEIKYAQYGVYAYYANPTIHSCWIHNNVYGIFGGTSSMTVTNNKIYDNTLDGGYFGGGTPKFYSNSIYDNTGNGLYFYASSGKIGYSSGTTSGLNEISNNGSWGIYANECTEIFMGSSDSEGNRIGGYNAVMGNTTNEVCSNSSHVEAEYNYWGTSSPTSALFTLVYGGTIDYVPYRTSDPNGGSNLAKRSAITGNDVAENKTNRWAGYDPNNLDLNKLSDLWLYGLDLSLSKKPEKAIEIYQRLIEKFPESVEAKKAMAKIHHLLRECNDKSQENYFVTLLQKEKGCKAEYKNTALSLAGYTYCDMGLPLEAVNIFKRVIDEYPDSSCSLGALYNLVVLNLKEIKDNSSASTYLEIMKKKYPGEALTLFARTEMGEEVDWSVLSKKTTPQPKVAAEKLPTEFMLHNNYPNPFNPVTNIKFDLPEDAHVTITVYDINGREVLQLVDRDMSAGYQNIIWNAKNKFGHNVASGFYICKMRTSTGFVKTNKMILMR